MSSYAVPRPTIADRCRNCRMVFVRDRNPVPGETHICVNCSAVSVVSADFTLRQPFTKEEVERCAKAVMGIEV